jgi:hypothetical protein
MPLLETRNQFEEVLKLPFCYWCGKTILLGEEKNKDHIPPQSCFARADRDFPLQLPTHISCNHEHHLEDEKVGQLIGLKYGKVPDSKRNRKLKIKEVYGLNGKTTVFVTNMNIRGDIRRWIRGFHAALYREPIPQDTVFAIETPFTTASRKQHGIVFDPPRTPQHRMFVEVIKTNRAVGNLDRIQSNNKNVTNECGWDQTDGGQWMCIFALDLYGWKDLGDIENFQARGCVGMYTIPTAFALSLATKAKRLSLTLPNYDVLDPFAK